MNSLLKKALAFNSFYPRLCFGASSMLLLGLCVIPFSLLKDYRHRQAQLTHYGKLFKNAQFLQKAQDLLTQADIEAPRFVTSKIESIELLKHLALRYEQSTNSSFPLSLNAHENRLRHKITNLSSSHLLRLQFELSKPVFADEEDLKELFALIENRSIFPYEKSMGTPFIFFKEFSIEKHFLPSCEKVYQITYKLEAANPTSTSI